MQIHVNLDQLFFHILANAKLVIINILLKSDILDTNKLSIHVLYYFHLNIVTSSNILLTGVHLAI